MHILMLPSWFETKLAPNNGPFIKDQAKALVIKGHQVGIIYGESFHFKKFFKTNGLERGLTAWSEDGIDIMRFLSPRHKKIEWIDLYFKKFLFKKYIRKHGKPDIIHVQAMWRTSNLVLWIHKKYHIPYIVTEHFSGFSRGILSASEINIMKKVARRSSYNAAVSEPFAILLKKTLGVDFSCLHNIVDSSFFSPDKATKKTNEFVFITASFMNENKNVISLVRAFLKAFSNKKNIKLIIAGYGPSYNQVNQAIIKENAADQITLTGESTRKEVRNLNRKEIVLFFYHVLPAFGYLCGSLGFKRNEYKKIHK